MNFSAKYKQLITSQRQHTSTSKLSATLSGSTASDRSRVLYSAPFRRLQMKAQVFPLEDNAAVRCRLTHSLEVSDIGRSIARSLAAGKLQKFLSPEEQIAFVDIVETACLMHDIGNPPFGHFGEQAIQRWFSKHGKEVYKKATSYRNWDSAEQAADFIYFDGNPQGLRIVSQLQFGTRPGMNLTFSQLFAGIKYPFSASEVRRAAQDSNNGKAGTKSIKKKAGYFWTEKNIVETMRKKLSIGKQKRHPLSYIMEAADDIAYCMSDIEDGVEKKLIDLDKIGKELRNGWAGTPFAKLVPRKWGTNWEDQTARFLIFKTQYALRMVQDAARQYINRHDSMINGEALELFPDDSSERKVLKTLKTLARTHLFRNEGVENLELAGYSIISGLLDHYKTLLELDRAKFMYLVRDDWPGKNLDVESRLYNRLPKKHIYLYRQKCELQETSLQDEWFHRAHLIIDYISGMTDRYALSTYQLLGGTSIV